MLNYDLVVFSFNVNKLKNCLGSNMFGHIHLLNGFKKLNHDSFSHLVGDEEYEICLMERGE